MTKPSGLWATPDYIRANGILVARFMTRIIEGCSLEEAQRGEFDEPSDEKYAHLAPNDDAYAQ